MIVTTRLYILSSLNDLDFHSRSQLYKKSYIRCPFYQKFRSRFRWLKFNVLPQPVGLLELMLNLFCKSDFQGRELCWCDVSGHLWTHLFQPWYDAIHDYALQFDFILNNLDIHSRPQRHGKTNTFYVQLFHCEVASVEQLKINARGGWPQLRPVWQLWVIWAFALLFFFFFFFSTCFTDSGRYKRLSISRQLVSNYNWYSGCGKGGDY